MNPWPFFPFMALASAAPNKNHPPLGRGASGGNCPWQVRGRRGSKQWNHGERYMKSSEDMRKSMKISGRYGENSTHEGLQLKKSYRFETFHCHVWLPVGIFQWEHVASTTWASIQPSQGTQAQLGSCQDPYVNTRYPLVNAYNLLLNMVEIVDSPMNSMMSICS